MLSLPDSPQTRDIINADILEKINSSAMLINVGRGTAINEDDLTDALNDGKIAAETVSDPRRNWKTHKPFSKILLQIIVVAFGPEGLKNRINSLVDK